MAASRPALHAGPVFTCVQVVLIYAQDRLVEQDSKTTEQWDEETLITYPMLLERLDICKQFLLPARRRPHKHKIIGMTRQAEWHPW